MTASLCTSPPADDQAETAHLDRVAGGFGGVGPPGWGGPAEGAVGELVHCPPGVLLEPVVVAALRAGVAETGPPACFVGDVVLVVALGGGAAADGAGAGGVPDLGQVPQLDPGVVAAGLVTVIAGVGGNRVDRDDQVRPGSGGAQPPGAVPAGPAVGRSNANPGPSRAPGPARFLWPLGSGRAQPWAMAWPWSSVTVRHQVVLGLRAAAAARSRVSQGSTGPRPGELAGPAGQAGQGGQRGGQGDPAGEPRRAGSAGRAGPGGEPPGRESLPRSRSR